MAASRLIGHGRASDLLLTSRTFTGAEADAAGLATISCAAAEVVATATALARRLVDDISPHALRATKRQLAIDSLHDDPATSVRDAQSRLEQMMTEADYREGAAALRDRRAPRWTDS
ncbi:MAG: enoyl-CoA hydratase-related protein [Acidimicrobiales bacterium]